MPTKISNKGKVLTPPILPSERGGSFSPSLRGSQRGFSSAFTLIELLVVIAIIAILSIVVVLTLNPAEMLRQARDQNRLSDMDTLTHVLSLYQTDMAIQGSVLGLGNASTVYVSLPDASLSGNATSTCASLGLPVLPLGYTYQCVSPQNYRKTNGQGWLPVNLSLVTTGNPLSSLPMDPQNASSSRLYYTYVTNGSQYELTTSLESTKYKLGGSNDVVSQDGGALATIYEKGSKLGLEPLDYGDPSLVGYWTFDEGSGGTVYDYSGSNATGSWVGTPSYYTSGKVGPYAGSFDASTIYGNVPSNAALYPAQQLTVSAWVNPNDWPGQYRPFIEGGGNLNISTSSGYYLGPWQSGGLQFDVGGLPNGRYFVNVPSSSVPLGTWSFVAGTVTAGGMMTLYVNGLVVASRTYLNTNIGYSGLPVDFGTLDYCCHASPNFFNGSIDDVRIYNRAFSTSEIQAIYNAEK